jgi:branched-chain amino acid transport system substrate-binding protein
VKDSKALKKVQSATLIAVIAIAAVGGGAAYTLLIAKTQTAEPIRIGIIADLDNTIGQGVWRAAIMAAEQVNADGGVLGKTFEVVAQDDDSETAPDVTGATSALTKLLSVDKADFVISNTGATQLFYAQEAICAQYDRIIFTTMITMDECTQRVMDNYQENKYFFKIYGSNNTAISKTLVDSVERIGKSSGFTKIALLYQDILSFKQAVTILNSSLLESGFEIVHSSKVPLTTLDFTSNLAAIQASGAQMLVPLIATQASVSLVKEWRDRESPFIMIGALVGCGDPDFWDITEGKCEYVSMRGTIFMSGYALTNKSLATSQAYLQRWGTAIPTGFAASTYDGVRFILPDAITRAGTTDTDAVIKALETIDVETSMARHFVYTKSHDIMQSTEGSASPPEDYQLMGIMQWQANKLLVPIAPEAIMRDAGASFQYPTWKGPWNNIQNP